MRRCRVVLFCLLMLCCRPVAAAPDAAGGGWILVPFPVYSPETGWALTFSMLGARRLAAGTPASSLLLSAALSEREQQSLALDPTLYLDSDRLLRAHVAVEDWPSDFYGLGNDTRVEDAETWHSRQAELKGEALWRVRGPWWLGPVLEWRHYRTESLDPAGLLATLAPRGIEGGQVVGAGVVVVRDSRDDVFWPREGSYARLATTLFDPAVGSDYRFHREVLDVRQYWPVTPETVLSLSQYVVMTRGDVPFQELARLGDVVPPMRLRGHVTGRFRDRDAAVVQAEWRVPLRGRWAGVVFAGLGDVQPGLPRWEGPAPRWTLGTGLRFRASRIEHINLRVDVAMGEDESGLYLGLMEAF